MEIDVARGDEMVLFSFLGKEKKKEDKKRERMQEKKRNERREKRRRKRREKPHFMRTRITNSTHSVFPCLLKPPLPSHPCPFLGISAPLKQVAHLSPPPRSGASPIRRVPKSFQPRPLLIRIAPPLLLATPT
jgi:hypothetical protein